MLAMQGPDVRLSKSLLSCKKAEFGEIAFVLGLSLDPKATAKMMLTTIITYFNAHLEKKLNPRFHDIFTSTRSWKSTVIDENIRPNISLASPTPTCLAGPSTQLAAASIGSRVNTPLQQTQPHLSVRYQPYSIPTHPCFSPHSMDNHPRPLIRHRYYTNKTDTQTLVRDARMHVP